MTHYRTTAGSWKLPLGCGNMDNSRLPAAPPAWLAELVINSARLSDSVAEPKTKVS